VALFYFVGVPLPDQPSNNRKVLSGCLPNLSVNPFRKQITLLFSVVYPRFRSAFPKHFLAGTVLLAIASSAQAQKPPTKWMPVEKPFTLKLGALVPSQSSMIKGGVSFRYDPARSTFLSAGFIYDFKSRITPRGNTMTYGVYGDIIFEKSFSRLRRSNFTTPMPTYGHATQSAYGLGLTARATTGAGWESGVSSRLYASMGFGLYMAPTRIKGMSNSPTAPVAKDNNFGLGGFFGIGLEIRSGIFAETQYSLMPSTELTTNSWSNLNGFRFNVGCRF
jgi:hypothetical protein